MRTTKQGIPWAILLALFTLGGNGGTLPSPSHPDTNRTVYTLNNGTVLVDYSAGTITNDAAALKAFASMAQSQNAFNTGALRLQISNVSHPTVQLNLQNATNQVYAIWGTTNLLSPWSVQTEVWPTNSELMPFTSPTLDQPSQFFLAQDWTGVTENGNSAPDWWFWKHFGTTALYDTNLDSRGNTLVYDYTNRLDPNVIFFILCPTNNYINSTSTAPRVLITGGIPYYYSIVVDPTHFTGVASNWAPFVSTNIVATFSPTQGDHVIWIGLKGLPADATETWRAVMPTFDSIGPTISVTNPAAIVAQPMITVQGLVSEELRGLTFDVSNALGVLTNQTGYTDAGSSYYDTKLREFTTNAFGLYDIRLTNGLSTITIHAKDRAGNTSTTNFNVTLDYSIATNPPALKIIWPRNGTPIAGDSFTMDLLVEDLTVKVTASANGQTMQGVIMRNGHVRGLTLPLTAGTNRIAITATDAAGNVTRTNINVMKASLNLSMISLNADQLNKSSVTVTGKVSDVAAVILVNGVKATITRDGTWVATGVPVSPVSNATFSVKTHATGSAPASQGPTP